MPDGSRVADADDVPADGTFLLTAERDGEDREVVLVRLADGTINAFENYCQHWTDVRLDGGSGATVRNGDIVCEKHGATFGKDDGCCDFGPCEGAYLAPVEIAVRDGAVYLSDEDYAFVDSGPAGGGRDDGDAVDLSASPGDRLGF